MRIQSLSLHLSLEFAISNSSLVGITYTFIFEVLSEINTSSPFILLASLFIVTPKKFNLLQKIDKKENYYKKQEIYNDI